MLNEGVDAFLLVVGEEIGHKALDFLAVHEQIERQEKYDDEIYELVEGRKGDEQGRLYRLRAKGR